jgi:hypothetical protein
MPTNPLQPVSNDPKSWFTRLVCAFSETPISVEYAAGGVKVTAPDGLMRLIRKIIVRAAKEESAYLVAGLCKTLHAANKATRDLEEEVGSACGKISPEVWAVNDSATDRLRGLVNNAASNAGRVGVLETQLASARSLEKIATARAESAEAECAKLRLLLNATREGMEKS